MRLCRIVHCYVNLFTDWAIFNKAKKILYSAGRRSIYVRPFVDINPKL
jgi:hypothetical protein